MDIATQFGLYIAGIRVPFIGFNISSQFGSLASASVSIPYSPFVLRIHEQTKVQIFSKKIVDGAHQEPKLEFDGIIVGIVRSRNVLGQASAQLTCMTDGYIWNRRKQYDFYLEQIADEDTRGSGEAANIRADGIITNYYSDLIGNNRFDTGCASASVLSTLVYGTAKKDAVNKDIVNVEPTYYEYIYNGNKFFMAMKDEKGSVFADRSLSPTYYQKYLESYKLSSKLYGISTSDSVKEFYQTEHFLNMISNSLKDLQGENTFWSIAAQVMQYGFYSIFDIPNPSFIRGETHNSGSVSGVDISVINSKSDNPVQVNNKESKDGSAITVADKKNRKIHGLAEYILKPVSVLGVPLKCNIIWPDQVINESLYYDVLNAPTRVTVVQHAIPNDEDREGLTLKTTKVVGPAFPEDNNHYFKSFNAHYSEYRELDSYSDYEKEYGINYRSIPLSYAFDATLLGGENETEEKNKKEDNPIKVKEDVKVSQKMNDFLNYNFAQYYYSSRSYNIGVTPDVDIVPGLPVIVLNRDGEHIIAFATGFQKSFDASNGNLNVSLSLSYPRYYYEDIKVLGNIIDPSSIGSKEERELAIKEMEIIFGTSKLIEDGGYEKLTQKIDEMFVRYIKSAEEERRVMIKDSERSVCTYSEYLEFHTGNPASPENKKTFVDEMPIKAFESSERANSLSHRYFKVYNHRKKIVEEYDPNKNPLSNKAIVKKHLEWTSEDQKV